ncbi:helix-turn-helix domain-containing protein [Teichococcus aestuarii]|uniref:Transcriptional regulator n=1 Tax=Teichococcus aestuarii TaxID=568898 RepID=A0A2U1UZC7_9PROT|nr:helix-turn-helix domain-containing protein [Pseudoroseomonas aestuarii]PWC27010.1 transcriptional regulator [Pseudoroseomonas aestuarii]
MQSVALTGMRLPFPFTVAPERSGRAIPGRPGRLLRGAEIYAEGSKIRQFYKVVSGAVRVCRVLPDARRFIAQFALPGEVFGLDGVEEHRFSAEAITEVVLIAFARKDIDAYMDEEPLAAQSWQAFTLEKLAAAQDRSILLGCRSATERVAHFLLDLAARSCPGRPSVDLPMSRYDIADYLGLTAETVSRVLTALRKSGMIAIEDNHTLHILERERLTEVADLSGVPA